MKKIIAILVVFAMVTGVAFAETRVGGSVETRWTIVSGNSAPGNPDAMSQMSVHAAVISLSGGNDDGTYGGTFQLTFDNGGSGGDIKGQYWPERAFVWWQPIPQVKLILGIDGNGMFNTANLSRWGHHRMPRNVSVENWDAHNFLLGNYDGLGAHFIINPIDNLFINLVFGLGNRDGTSAGSMVFTDIFKERIMAQIQYNLDGVGNFYVTYIQRAAWGPGWPFDGGHERIGLTFFGHSLVEGLQFEVGGNYAFDQQDGNDVADPIRIGVGIHYNGDGWGVRARARIRPRDEVKNAAGVVTQDAWVQVIGDVMPFYDFGFLTAFLNIRLNSNTPAAVGEAGKLGWHINPYIRVPMGGDFRLGALIDNEDGDEYITWKVALSMLWAF